MIFDTVWGMAQLKKETGMKRYFLINVPFTIVCLIVAGFFSTCIQAGGPDLLMTIEELQKRLGNPEVVIVDVRIAKDWKTSDSKIKGAIWQDPMNFKSWADKFPRDKTLILYCA